MGELKRESVMEDKSIVKIQIKKKRESKTPKLKFEDKPDIKNISKLQVQPAPSRYKEEDDKKHLGLRKDEIKKVRFVQDNHLSGSRGPDDESDPNDINIDRPIKWEFLGVFVPMSRHSSAALRGDTLGDGTAASGVQTTPRATPARQPSVARNPSRLRTSSIPVASPIRRSPSISDFALPVKPVKPIKHQSPSPAPVGQVVIRVEEDPDEDSKKLSPFKNPEVKIKKVEDGQLDPDTVSKRLRLIGEEVFDIPLEQSLRDHLFKRSWMQSEHGYGFGGNWQEAFPEILDKYSSKTGIKHFAYANLEMQMHAPQVPGAPGLFFVTGGPEDRTTDDTELVTTFTRIKSGAWCYMGLYQFYGADSLTKDEWARQTPKVMNTWAKHLCKTRWGATVRERIATRKWEKRMQANPDPDTFQEEDLYQSVTEDDIKEAYLTGEEVMHVYALKCVGYDVNLQLDLIENYDPTWTPPPKEKSGPKRKRGEDGEGNRRKAKKQKTTVKIKPEDDDDDYEDRPRQKKSVRS